MEKKEDKKEFSDFIFDNLEGESDGWQTGYNYGEVIKAMNYAYNLGVDSSAEKAEVLMTLNNIPFVSNTFSVTTDYKTINGETESLERKYSVFKPSIQNLKIIT